MALGAAMKGKRIMFVCHRDFLVEQTAEAFKSIGIEYTFIAAGYKYNNHCNVVIASIGTLQRRMDLVAAPDILIIDEAIHAAAAGWAKVIEYYQAKGCFTVGLCACAERTSGQGLNKWFKAIVEGPSMGWLIENGYLSRYKIFAPQKPDLSGLHTRGGDYITEEISDKMNKPSITGNAIGEYKKIAGGKQGVAFCCSIQHSRDVCQGFINAGISAVHIGSDTNKSDRKEMLKDFRAGRIKILTAVDIFSEGFDLPAVEHAALLRPTQSLNIYLQQIGRALRVSPGKEYAYIADHANNTARFGMPDEIREWTLEDRKKTNRDGSEKTIPVRQCAPAADDDGVVRGCHYCHKPAPSCPNCGRVYLIQGRDVKEIEGELQEIQIQQEKKEKRMEKGRAKTIADLQRIAKERGYKSGWVWKQAQLRGIRE